MRVGDDSPLPGDPETPESSERPEQSEEAATLSILDINALSCLDCTNPEVLRPALAALMEAQVHRFDPVRFRFMEALAQKALKQRTAVAGMLEEKALQALSDYLNDYLTARERAVSSVTRLTAENPEVAVEAGGLLDAGDFAGIERLTVRPDGDERRGQGALAALTREIRQRSVSDEFASQPSFEDELRQQELELLDSTAGVTTGDEAGVAIDKGRGGPDEPGVMRYFRESMARRHSEKLVARAIRERPENPGPANSQALVVSALSLMRDLSPGYASRFVAYMDTLLWLEQAGEAAAPAKAKAAGRRKT